MICKNIFKFLKNLKNEEVLVKKKPFKMGKNIIKKLVQLIFFPLLLYHFLKTNLCFSWTTLN